MVNQSGQPIFEAIERVEVKEISQPESGEPTANERTKISTTMKQPPFKEGREVGAYLAPTCELIEIKVEGGYTLSDLEIPDYGDQEDEW